MPEGLNKKEVEINKTEEEKTFDEKRQEVAKELTILLDEQKLKLSLLEERVSNFRNDSSEYKGLKKDIHDFQYDVGFLLKTDEKINSLKSVAEKFGKLKEYEEIETNLILSNHKNFNQKAGELIEILDKKVNYLV